MEAMITRSISSNDDMIDTRDVLEYIDTLDEDDDAEEITLMQELISEAEDYSEDLASDGIFLVRDSYFIDYAQQFAEDIGAVDDNARWPVYCIDWERAARELQMDYSQIRWDGVDWWLR